MSQATSLVSSYTASGHSAFPKLSKIDVKNLRGKTIWVVSDDAAATTFAQENVGIEAAAKILGIKVRIFDAKGTATLAAEGLNDAVAAKPAGIIMSAIEAKLVNSSLLAARQAHIPVVSLYEGPVTPNTIFATVEPDPVSEGRALAGEALAKTHCQLDGVYFGASVFTQLTHVYNEMRSTVKKLCPQKCQLSFKNVDVSSEATSSGPLAVNTVNGNKKINMLVAGTDDFTEYMVPALQQAGSNVPIMGVLAYPVDIGYIRSGSQLADVASSTNQAQGWAALDELLRAMEGKSKSASAVLPARLMTKANIPASNTGQLLPGFVNYENKFLASWQH